MVRSTLQKRIASALLLTTIAVQLQTSGALTALQSVPVFQPLIGVQSADAQSATRTFGSNDAIRAFVTATPGGTFVDGETSLRNDNATASKICQMAGYNTVSSKSCVDPQDGRCNYTSCGDNYHQVWNGNSWSRENACGGTWLGQLTCSDPTVAAVACNDGIDNDGDGLRDFPQDPGCINAQDTDESNGATPQCRNGIDDDGDGKIDALVNATTGGGGNFVQENADPKYGKTWIVVLTCRTAAGNNVTYNQGGNAHTLAGLVRQAITNKGLNLTGPAQAVVRSDGGTGAGFNWDDNSGTIHMPTVTAVCQILGNSTDTYVSSTCRDDERSGIYPNGKCNFHSPGDNNMHRFTGTLSTAACSDGADNDGDGQRDYPADSGCASANDASEVPHDPQCTDPNDTTEADPLAQCQDGIDNDGDGATDFPNDFSCTSPTDNDETNQKSACQDGIDNDGDGLTDFPQDPGCISKQDNDESNAPINSSNCVGNITAPDTVVTGQQFQGTIVTQNNGTATWTSAAQYRLASRNPTDNTTWGTGRVELAQSVPPNSSATFTRTFTAPSTPGTYNFDWAMVQDGVAHFGTICHKAITVNQAQCPASNVSATFEGNQGPWEDVAPNGDAKAPTFVANVVAGTIVKVNSANGTYSARIYGGVDQLPLSCDQGTLSFTNNSNQTISSIRLNAATAGVTVPNGATRAYVSHDEPGSFNYFDNSGNRDHRAPCQVNFGITPTSCTQPQCSDGLDNDGDGLVDFPADPGCINAQDNDESPRNIGNLDVEKVLQGTITPGQDATYVITVRNTGTIAAQNVNVYDYFLDANDLKYVPFTFVSSTGVTCSYQSGLQQVACPIGTVPAGQTITMSLRFNTPVNTTCNAQVHNRVDAWINGQQAGADVDDVSSSVQCLEQCRDGRDNDNDGLTDFPQDPGCVNATDNDESNLPQCQDGIDNDQDGATDYPNDFSCTSPTDTDETNPKSQCQDGIDNDQDGRVDFPSDVGCVNNQDNDERDPLTYLYIYKTGPVDIDRGANIPYTISIQNYGAVAAQNVVVEDIFPTGLVFVPAQSTAGCVAGNNLITCNIAGGINPGGQKELTLVFTVSNVVPCEGTIQNRAIARASNVSGSNTSNQWSTTVHCTAQCQDGIDNDGDGATDFPNDFSCTSPTDNDETNQKAACQDGIDNDGDNLVDFPQDPGCVSRQDNDENNAPTPQCRDGIDNDGDGRVDALDPGCSNPDDNNEGDEAACNDRRDNDFDGLIDFPLDPGCVSLTDTDEANNAQCQDGIDNDNDGATDYPNDFSCTSPTDNDETNQKAACQDGFDNDFDGLTDFPQDPGCVSKQDNDETNAVTPQCSDGIDNDNDGATDYPADFSCSSPTDTDETNPKAACQDGFDNDFDGKVDFPLDPGCTSKQDNDEFNAPVPQCRDGIDNDGDGRVDALDPGCSNPDDNNEGDDPACSDRIDNDGDGLIDFPFDPGCVNAADTDEFNQTQTVDVQIQKTGPNTINPGQTIVYTIQVGNSGNTAATNVVVTDPVIQGINFNDALSYGPCSIQNNAVVCPLPNLAPGQFGSFTLAFDFPGTNCLGGIMINNTATIRADQDTATTGNNTSSAVTSSVCTPTPQCSDGIDNDNDGATDFPNDFSCSSPTDTDETNPKAACQDGFDNDFDGLVDFPLDPGCVSKQDNDETNVPATQCADGIDNDGDGKVDGQDAGCQNPTDNNEGDGPADLAMTLTGPSQIQGGSNATYTATVTNNGPDAATTPFSFNVNIPAGVTYNSSLSSPSCSQLGSQVICSSITLGVNQSAQRTIVFNVPATIASVDSTNLIDIALGVQTAHAAGLCGTTIQVIATIPPNTNPDPVAGNNQAFVFSAIVCQNQTQCSDGFDNDFDGRIDFPLDPGCSSAQDNNEGDEAACQDRRDNDGDGLIDWPLDPGCVSPLDTDEFNAPLPQCSDGIDNDNDGRADMLDPGCTSPQDNNEGDDPACSDRIDNDQDGRIDFPLDPGCTGPTDNDETNPAVAQCSDGIDNDFDGKIDFPLDPGCSNAQDNNESDDPVQYGCIEIHKETFDPHGTPLPIAAQFTFILDATRVAYNSSNGYARFDQVLAGQHGVAEIIPSGWTQLSVSPQNGMVTVAPGTNCAQITFRNRQVFVANAQCSDGYDNDGDGLTDYPADQGCSSATDNDEYNSTFVPQCRDGIDNDGDNLVDFPNDPGCSNNDDNNESNVNAVSACSDNIDNDGDGLKDYPADPGCSSLSDIDEFNAAGTFACNDGIDNDGDGVKDFPQDPGCVSATDTDEFNFRGPRCSDGIDNDADGLIDYPQDTGCTTPYDDNEYNDRLWLDRWREFWNWNW